MGTISREDFIFHLKNKEPSETKRSEKFKMLLQIYWIVGFVDGEGCFSFSIFKNENMRNNVQIQGEFTVRQHKRDIKLLYALKKFFKCGTVSIYNQDCYHYRVKNLKDLLDVIIPFFEKYPLKTNKKYQLKVFKELCLILKSKDHLKNEGLENCKLLVEKLSSLKKSENLEV
jgi:hypothetical protein